MHKQELRKNLLSKRQLIELRDLKSLQIQNNVTDEVFAESSAKESLIILSYSSIEPEVGTDILHSYIRQHNHILALPYCEGSQIIPIQIYDESRELSKGAFNIMEPLQSLTQKPERIVPHHAIDIIIVPGVGFDRYGNRLGYGKGYYDRFLPLCENATKIGICYQEQLLEYIPTDIHDVKVDIIITDKEKLQILN